jgi:Domain of Unknown Function (DUF1080)
MIWKPQSLVACALSSLLFAAPGYAAHGMASLNAKEAGPDFVVQGEYAGAIGEKAKVGAQVIALGNGNFDAVLYTQGLPGAGWDGKTTVRLKGKTSDGIAAFNGKNFHGTIRDGVFAGTAENDVHFSLKKVERESPTLGATPPPGAVVLFDGANTNAWSVGKIAEDHLLGVPATTKQKFENFLLHIEFRTPFMPFSRGQGRGNSGVYLADQYEVQVLDSFGLAGLDNECGGIYQQARPLVNMCFPPLSWQTYDIEFRAARFAPDEKTKRQNAVVTVRHNGVPIQYELELKHPTPGGNRADEHAGPIFLQNHGNPVRFRNIWILVRP